MQTQVVRYTTQALKKYFEAHLAMKVEDEVNRDLRREGNPQPPQRPYKPHRIEADKVPEKIFTLLEMVNYRSRWSPVDQMIRLGGLQTLLQAIFMTTINTSFAGKSEIVRACLDVIGVCCVSPRVQLMLCDKFELPDKAVVSVDILSITMIILS